jgi:GntR family transcriptional repressor for pyruvate dehydrogenase complex
MNGNVTVNQSKPYRALKSTSLSALIVENIEQRIMSGDLKTGERLPPERELAELYSVSRTAVREAMRALMEKGLVEILVGRGTFVVDSTSKVLRNSLSLVLRVEQKNRIANIVEIREMLEPEIAARAAQKATPEHIAKMEASIVRMDESIDDIDAFIVADQEFHQALAEATQNELIPTLIGPFMDLLQEQRWRVGLAVGGTARGQEHHKRILRMVVDKDPEGAFKAMKMHLKQVRDDIASLSQDDEYGLLQE